MPADAVRPAAKALACHIALQVANSIAILQEICPRKAEQVAAIGAITGNDFLMQYQANILGIPVVLPGETEPSCGAASLARASLLRAEPPPGNTEPRRIYTPQRGKQWQSEQLAQ